MKPQIVANKRIGRVVFLVEGDVDEPNLLQTIFCDVLGYGLIHYDKRDGSVKEYGKADDPYSRVFVVPMPTSAIVHLPVDEDYMDAVYEILSKYELGGMEAATYYIFDRDWRSNSEESVLSKINLLRNPYDNGIEMPGALLLSYPCAQAYYCEAHDKTEEFAESHAAKVFVNSHHLKTLTNEEIICAANNMLVSLSGIRAKTFDLMDLNDYSEINREVFSYQQKYRFESKGTFLTLSLISLALIDLGIIHIE